jgi:putative MATE family efflux protein
MGAKNRSIDMINGPLIKNLFIFTMPLVLSALLQIFYNAADMIVIGNFSVKTGSVAAIGATGSITNLIIGLFIGLSTGVNVVSAKYFGQKNNKGLSYVTHTSIAISLVGGVVLGIIGVVFARPLLAMINVDAAIMDQAVLYMQIIFAGLPAQLVYNFGSALLRSIGETKRPMYYLMVSGVVNVILNVFFVIACKMDVEGVAIATVVSQILSAALVMICLSRVEGDSRFVLKKLGIKKRELFSIVRYGLPAGIQQSLFTFSHVILQSEINSYGEGATAGNAAANNLENFVYMALAQFSVAALTFVSQNLGAGNYPRVKKVVRTCLTIVGTLGFGLGALSVLFRTPLLKIYLPNDPVGLEYGRIRFTMVALTDYFLIMHDIYVGALRAMGYSVTCMIISVAVICGARILWLYTFYAMAPSITMLYVAYPLSWILAFLAVWVAYMIVAKKKLNPLGGPVNA